VLLRARVSLVDRPGALLAVAKVIADLGGNIVDIEILASSDGRVIDDLVIDLPTDDPDGLVATVSGTGAEVLNLRRTVRLSGQRPDLDLLHRVMAEPAAAVATVVSMAPPIWSADWSAMVENQQPQIAVRASVGAPDPLPAGLPQAVGTLPRRATVDGRHGERFEVVGLGWGEQHRLYLGRLDGPTFLQVELLQLRRVSELAVALAVGTPVATPVATPR
jgi:ACT domain